MSKCFDEGMLQAFSDGELFGAELQAVNSHLAHCAACSEMVEELVRENELVASAMAAEFQAAVPTEQLRRRIDAAIAGAGVESRTSPVSLVNRASGWFADLFRQPVYGYASLALLVAFAGIFGVLYTKSSAPVPPQVAVNNNPPANEAAVTPDPPKQSNSASTTAPTSSPGVVTSAPQKPFKGSTARRRSTSPSAVAKQSVQLLPGERSYLKAIAALNSTIKSNDRPMRPALRAEYERNLAFVDRALAAARTAAKKNPNDPDAAEFVYSAYQSKVDLLNTVADARTFRQQ